MTTTYSVHPPGATARRFLSHHHHHSHSPHQQHRRHQASSLDSIRPTARIISSSTAQRVVNGTDNTTVTAIPPATVGIIPPPPPFDTIAAPNPAIAALNGTICRPSSSDCGGSSSGLGGMTKTDIISSDESSLASDAPIGVRSAWVIPHPVLLNNAVPPMFMSCNTVPTSSTSPVPMFFDQVRGNISATQRAPTSIGSNDLFVHVQTGETLSIVIGNDVQHITGPATVRMVNQAGMSPSALPLHVPPGHMVQQMVDEQGVLRHLILSPEATPRSRLMPTASPLATITSNTSLHNSAATTSLKPFAHNSPSPPIVPPYPPPAVPYPLHNNSDFSEDNLRKTWIPHGKKFDGPHVVQVPTNSTDDHEQSQSGASANEEEEWERLTEMLSRMQSPQILRVAAKEADIVWQELDTSEASAPGGPFPQIDASEFTYDIVLFESVGRIVSSYRCEPDSGNRVRLCRLRPNTEYYVQLRASLEERGLQGSPSTAVKFRTLTTVPEPPHPPRLVSRTHNSVTVSWRSAIDNGSAITCYRLELASDGQQEEEGYEAVYEGLAEQFRIKGLTPSTRYRVHLIATNNNGDSQPSAAITVCTSALFYPPKQPHCPQLVSLSAKCIKLSWNTQPQHSYTLEMSDIRTNEYSVVCERSQLSSVNINDVISNHQYHFRLIVHNDAGDSEPSEALIVRTPSSPSIVSSSPPPIPSRPHIISNNGVRLEIGWKAGRTNEKDLGFLLEGSSDEKSWTVVYRGSAISTQVRDHEMRAFRVAALRKQLQSGWSDVLRIRREEKQRTISIPGQCAAPTITEISKGCLRVQWNPPDNVMSSIIYQLHRVNLQPSSIIYQGEATMFDLSNCAPGEEMEVQVRAVSVSFDGARLEGEWSRVAVGRTAAQPPSPPTDVHVDADNVLHWSPPNSTNGAPIIEYIIERILVSSSITSKLKNDNDQATNANCGWTVKRESAETLSISVAEGQPGCKYQLSVSAVNSGGTSIPSECIYVSIPPRSPAAPLGLHALPQGCRQLQMSWRTPCCNGSEIFEYNIRVLDDSSGNEIRLIKQEASVCECIIDSLEAGRTYRMSVHGVNAIGIGDPSWITATTLAPPPQPPNLLCSEAGPNYLKLKWKPPGNASAPTTMQYYYYLEKENDNGKFSPIYEGDNRYAKVRNLNESTKYRFRIRCSSRVSGAGPWSSPFEFSTEQLPPPTIRSAPMVTEVASGSFQVEWSPVRISSANAKESLLYRLQVASRNSTERSNNTWKTAYEGLSTSYSLSTSESVQLRVQCVRIRDGIESVSAPSAIQFATPSLAVIPRKKALELTEQEMLAIRSQDVSNVQWIQYHILSDKHYAFVILLLFAAIAFGVALILDALLFEQPSEVPKRFMRNSRSPKS
ncbi:Fibronectin type III domain-containing protein 3B [Dirofilaria immitis]